MAMFRFHSEASEDEDAIRCDPHFALKTFHRKGSQRLWGGLFNGQHSLVWEAEDSWLENLQQWRFNRFFFFFWCNHSWHPRLNILAMKSNKSPPRLNGRTKPIRTSSRCIDDCRFGWFFKIFCQLLPLIYGHCKQLDCLMECLTSWQLLYE